MSTEPIFPKLRIGSRLGPYRLIELIGRGGMGEVYQAERADDHYHSRVAIKLVRVDHDASRVAWRFRSERQILAQLEHPNIARLIDGGATEEGVPYLVMELIAGQPIDAYCEQRHLTISQRVRLFLQVCAAVSFAHQRLVVHRDLKPGNILVTAEGTVKLLDFGIAKLLETEQPTTPSDMTATHVRVMTLEYASPEQVRGDPITTASDVYSLGVVLYRLLTGRSPYREDNAAERAVEILSDSPLSKPSTAVNETRVRTATGEISPQMQFARKRARRALQGDLDNVLLMALRKEPERRYASVDQFAEDLRNYLDGMPVRARGDSLRYRTTKFMSRHKYAVTAASLGALALVAGIVTTTWQAHIAAEQTRIAREEVRKTRAVQSFMTSLFEKNTRLQPDALKARNMRVHELLVAASDKVLHDLTDTPAVRMEVMNTVAGLLIDINEFDRAGTLYRESVKIAREMRLTGADAYVEGLIGVAFAGRLLGRGKEAAEARDEALRVLDGRNDRTSLLRARAMGTTIAQFSADPMHEIELMTAAVELFKTRYPNDPGHFNSVFALGQLHRTQGDMRAAVKYFQAASQVFEQSGLQAYSDLGSSYAWAAFCEMQLGWVDDALRDYEKGIELLRQHAGDVSIYTRIHLGLYGQALHQAGKLEQAHQYFDLVLTPEHVANPTAVEFDTAVYKALGLLQEGRSQQALAVLDPYGQRAIEFGTRFVPNGVQYFAVRARALALQGKIAAAKAELTRVAELPQFYGVPAQKSDCYLAAVIDVALADNDLPTARAALAQRGPLDAPREFDLDYLQLVMESARLKQRMGDLHGAGELTSAALAHLQKHAGNSNFAFMRQELQRVHAAARRGGE
ncbi:serine/threonine-protein kinase [Peristeroidobacter agariperforans]|uniref:serine/threonine-protein kinase n=1 Tax=Peristeroidobacter agariperforans TaxID=268404 RepID=UPI0018E541EA|nr:serine/threonine-protein kinase [Peristeroidobacter agariperforans]